ncbi:MAG: DNA methyltransferase, partial [Smithella sp.]
MNQKYEKLKGLLQELFQLDQPDLDFGIYRIMHAKSAEVTKFLDEDLLPQVEAAFAQYKTADKSELETQYKRAVDQAKELGFSYPEEAPKVKELKERLNTVAVDTSALESEVYDHLYSFFRRYYSEGDFLSKRVYKPGVYAIPYEGEEVNLYWANYDQYYIKTSEYLRDYAFRLSPENAANPMRVHFMLIDAAEGEHDNVKETQGKERKFKLALYNPVSLDASELVIHFTYQQAEEKQKELNTAAETAVLALGDSAFALWIQLLGRKYRRADGTESDNTWLRVHLDRYTARNTFDYFIHKDLKTFLNRELDFYIKNEVMHLDDIESESAPKVEQYLSKIKVIRTIAGKIIDFLAQLEDFQKKLWLKKKFVTQTSWCVRIGIVPKEFYPEIAANEAQWEEWKALHGLEGELFASKGNDLFESHAVPGTVEFLSVHPTLMIDTCHFSADFTARLLDALGDIDKQTDGVLVHSENFQALNLMQRRYREKIKCVYIDPPYNTGNDGFVYKDNYQHSSWMSMMKDRVDLAKEVMSDDSAHFTSINEIEIDRLSLVLSDLLEPVNLITVRTKIAGVSGSHLGKSLRNANEYLLINSKSPSHFSFTERVYDEEELWQYIQEMEKEDKSWKYTSVLEKIDDGELIKIIQDGSNNDISIYQHFSTKINSINSVALTSYAGDYKAAYYDNVDKIFRTTNAQSSIRKRVMEATRDVDSDFISIEYIPKRGRNAGRLTRLFFKDRERNLVAFLSDTVSKENGQIMKKIIPGTLWTDVQYNNLALEGGIVFDRGKKPVFLIKKIIDLMID